MLVRFPTQDDRIDGIEELLVTVILAAIRGRGIRKPIEITVQPGKIPIH
jgi:hypothetical protein